MQWKLSTDRTAARPTTTTITAGQTRGSYRQFEMCGLHSTEKCFSFFFSLFFFTVWRAHTSVMFRWLAWYCSGAAHTRLCTIWYSGSRPYRPKIRSEAIIRKNAPTFRQLKVEVSTIYSQMSTIIYLFASARIELAILRRWSLDGIEFRVAFVSCPDHSFFSLSHSLCVCASLAFSLLRMLYGIKC